MGEEVGTEVETSFTLSDINLEDIFDVELYTDPGVLPGKAAQH